MKKSPEPSLPEQGWVLHDRPPAFGELELPNSPDFISRRSPISLDRMLVLLEERRKLFGRTPGNASSPRRLPVPVEFVL
jgi:hypothetical protein